MTKRYRRLVIDTDIVSSAGGETARDTRSILCRDFLKAVLLTGHSVVLSKAVMEEWHKHQSNYTRIWLHSMFARRKIEQMDIPDDEQLRFRVGKATTNEKKRDAMLKDVHLIEAALQADKIVISMDGTVKRYFQEITREVIVLRDIVWVNPCKDEETPLEWLQNGAEPEKKRCLGFNIL